MRRLNTALTVLVLLSVAGGNAGGAVQYTVTDLGGGEAYGINATGQVVGQNADGHGFFYSNGTMTDIGTFGRRYSFALGINDSGQAVGWAQDGADVSQAFLYSAGVLQKLSDVGGGAQGINAAGQVVGWSYDANGVLRACRYSTGATIFLDIFPDGHYSFALDINDSGEVVGYGEDGAERAFLYENGIMTGLGGSSGAAQKINSSGVAVGGQYFSDTVWHAFQFIGGTATDLGTLGGPTSWADGINDSGQVVGVAENAAGVEHAFLYTSGPMADLNDLIDPALGWTLQEAHAVNDSGWIVGKGLRGEETRAFLLMPVPEPSALGIWSVLGTLGIMLGWWRRRRAA
ncbi:MAG: hypothetical protein ACYC35_28050 [Pirellulales bacterium]